MIKYFSTYVLVLLSITTATAQITSDRAVEVVQQQLDAYNAKDLDAFVAVFHSDAEIYNLGDFEPMAKGMDDLLRIYGNLFRNSPNLHSSVVSRQVIGNKVLDYEVITGRNNQAEPLYLIAIYEVEKDKIKRCFFVRP